MLDQREALRNIRTFPQLIKFLRDELDWPIESDDFEELTFDYTPEETPRRFRRLSGSGPYPRASLGAFFS
jgi:hypothetical protein